MGSLRAPLTTRAASATPDTADCVQNCFAGTDVKSHKAPVDRVSANTGDHTRDFRQFLPRNLNINVSTPNSVTPINKARPFVPGSDRSAASIHPPIPIAKIQGSSITA